MFLLQLDLFSVWIDFLKIIRYFIFNLNIIIHLSVTFLHGKAAIVTSLNKIDVHDKHLEVHI